MDNILSLINKDDWINAIAQIPNLFDNIVGDTNLFHFACMRGKDDIIDKYIELNSSYIYMSDHNGNTGAHHLALNGWDDKLINLLQKDPMFLKLKNLSDEFIFNLVLLRPKTLDKIIDLMIDNDYVKYLNFIKSDNSNLILDIMNLIYDESSIYLSILEKLSKLEKIDFNLPSKASPLFVAISKKNKFIVNYLLDNVKSIDINIKANMQYTPLIVAILNNMKHEAIKMIKMGVDINYGGSENNFVPLSLCFQIGLFEIAEKIIERDDVQYNNLDASNSIPLMYLIEYIANHTDKYKDATVKNILVKTIQNSDLNMENIFGISSVQKLSEHDFLKDFNLNKNIPVEIKTDIILPEIDIESGHGLFNADSIHNIIYIIYILSKYNNATIPMEYPNPEKKIWDKYRLNSQIVLQNDFSVMFGSIIMFYVDIFHGLLHHILFWGDKYTYFYSDEKCYFLKKAILSKHRFVIIKLSLIQQELFSHANILIYDKKRNVISRFEPYGDWEFIDSYFLDNKLLDLFKSALTDVDIKKIKTLRYLRPSEYLNKTKFQSSSRGDNPSFKNLGDPDGYCLAWCYWFTELKFLNPDVNEKILVESALKKIISESDKTDPNPLLSHIRGYAKHLDNQKNIILTQMDISKHDFYKLTYTNNTLSTVMNSVEKFIINRY